MQPSAIHLLAFLERRRFQKMARGTEMKDTFTHLTGLRGRDDAVAHPGPRRKRRGVDMHDECFHPHPTVLVQAARARRCGATQLALKEAVSSSVRSGAAKHTLPVAGQRYAQGGKIWSVDREGIDGETITEYPCKNVHCNLVQRRGGPVNTTYQQVKSYVLPPCISNMDPARCAEWIGHSAHASCAVREVCVVERRAARMDISL